MVDLPTVGNQIVTSNAPQSSVSPGTIERQYSDAAGAMDKVAGNLMDVAVKGAQTEAADELQQQKITRNADGSVNVQNPVSAPLLFGDAGEAFTKAVQVGTIAQHSNDLSQHFTELHAQFPADPAGFRQAADAYLAKRAQAVTGPMGEAIQQQGQQLLTQHFNAITSAAASSDIRLQASSIEARQQSLRDDVMALARGGVTINDPVMQSKIDEFHTLTAAKATNPLFGYSKEQSDLDNQRFAGEAVASTLIHDVDATYKSQDKGGGFAGAMAKAQDILTNPGYKLSQQEREQYYHRAVADIRANEALRRQDLSQARAAFSELSMVSAGGGRVDSNDVENVASAFRAAGDPGSAARVYAAFARKPLNDDFGKQPLAVQTQQIAALHGANAAASAFQFFTGKGYSPAAAAGIVGNLVHESGIDPAALGDNGTSGGIAQFHNERLAALKQFAAARGKPSTDFQTQLEFIDHELHSTESGTLSLLQAARTPEDAAAAFINYERPQGWTAQNPAGGLGYQSRQALARKVFDGQPGDVSMGPAGTAWLEVNRQATLNSAAKAQWQQVVRDYNEAGIRPAPKLVSTIVDAARAVGNTDLLENIAADSQRMNVVAEEAQKPLPSMQSDITALTAAGASGDLSPGHAALLTDLRAKYNAISEGLRNNPIATTVANFPDKFTPPGPIDFSSAGSLAGSLAERAAISQFASRNWQTETLPTLDQADIRQVRDALQGPQGAIVLSTMANTLHPDEMRTLLENKAMRDSIAGMQSNLDPNKMETANGVVDKLWRANPALAEQLLGPKSMDKLHTWQSLMDTFAPTELAKMLNRADDPSVAEARNEAIKEANKETLGLTPADMAYKLGSSWGIPILSSLANPITGATPSAPFDSIKGGAMVADYRAAYAALRANGVPNDKAADQALQRLRSSWGISQAAGNQVMKDPPEMFYPSIGGSQDWIGQDLNKWIVGKAGPQMTEGPRTLEAGIGGAGADRNWKVLGLISDGQTEAEISAGQRPSYGVAIRKADGTQVLFGMSGHPSDPRIVFDPKDYIARYSDRLDVARKNIAINRAMHGGDRQDFLHLRQGSAISSDRPDYLFGESLP